jgi:hypothetical protein
MPLRACDASRGGMAVARLKSWQTMSRSLSGRFRVQFAASGHAARMLLRSNCQDLWIRCLIDGLTGAAG